MSPQISTKKSYHKNVLKKKLMKKIFRSVKIIKEKYGFDTRTKKKHYPTEKTYYFLVVIYLNCFFSC